MLGILFGSVPKWNTRRLEAIETNQISALPNVGHTQLFNLLDTTHIRG